VRDLRRLLELYQRWQPRVFNHCSYNQFEQTLEKMSGTHALKVRHSSGSSNKAAAAPPAARGTCHKPVAVGMLGWCHTVQ
jgi:hypothetical protein